MKLEELFRDTFKELGPERHHSVVVFIESSLRYIREGTNASEKDLTAATQALILAHEVSPTEEQKDGIVAISVIDGIRSYLIRRGVESDYELDDMSVSSSAMNEMDRLSNENRKMGNEIVSLGLKLAELDESRKEILNSSRASSEKIKYLEHPACPSCESVADDDARRSLCVTCGGTGSVTVSQRESLIRESGAFAEALKHEPDTESAVEIQRCRCRIEELEEELKSATSAAREDLKALSGGWDAVTKVLNFATAVMERETAFIEEGR